MPVMVALEGLVWAKLKVQTSMATLPGGVQNGIHPWALFEHSPNSSLDDAKGVFWH